MRNNFNESMEIFLDVLKANACLDAQKTMGAIYYKDFEDVHKLLKKACEDGLVGDHRMVLKRDRNMYVIIFPHHRQLGRALLDVNLFRHAKNSHSWIRQTVRRRTKKPTQHLKAVA